MSTGSKPETSGSTIRQCRFTLQLEVAMPDVFQREAILETFFKEHAQRQPAEPSVSEDLLLVSSFVFFGEVSRSLHEFAAAATAAYVIMGKPFIIHRL